MYETVLVATDGSDEANAALAHALDVASASEGVVYVLTVVNTSNPMQFGIAEVGKLNEAASQVVEDTVDAHADHDVEIHGDVRRGKPASVILEYADEIDADLIVAGQRGGDSLSDAILGSTTDRLAQLTDVPLTIVPVGAQDSKVSE